MSGCEVQPVFPSMIKRRHLLLHAYGKYMRYMISFSYAAIGEFKTLAGSVPYTVQRRGGSVSVASSVAAADSQ